MLSNRLTIISLGVISSLLYPAIATTPVAGGYPYESAFFQDGNCPQGVPCGATTIQNVTTHTRTITEKSTVTVNETVIPTTATTTMITTTVTKPVIFNDCTTTSTQTVSDDLVIVEKETVTDTTTVHAVVTSTEFVTSTVNVTTHCLTITTTEPSVPPSDSPTPSTTANCNLAAPTALVGKITGTTEDDVDDEAYKIVLGFPITLWGNTFGTIGVSSNGVIGLISPSGTMNPSGRNGKLPDNTFPQNSAMVFWDDLYITKGTNQGIFYELSGPSGARVLDVEYRAGKFGVPHAKYHFTVTYRQAQPNVLQVNYHEIFDSGKAATIGIQGPSRQVILHSSKLEPKTQLVFNTETGSIEVSKF